MPLVSIITPAYKASEFIAHTAQSVLAQTMHDFEWIIASDDGKDYVSFLAAGGVKDARIRMVSTGGKGTGESHARNCAAAAANGRVVVSLDADDRLCPEALEVMSPLAMAHGAAYSALDIIDYDSGKHLPNCNRPSPEGLQSLNEGLRSNIHTFAWIAFDREKMGGNGWMEWAARWADMLFFASCCDVLGQIYFTPEPLYRYYRREGSLCNTPDAARQFQEAAALIVRKIGEDKSLWSKQPDTRQTMINFLERRHEIEELFDQALKNGECADYQDFLLNNLPLFHEADYSPR